MKKTNRLTEKRSERKKVFLKSGAYLIVTDAEKTEKNYFEGIKNIIPDSLKNDLQIKIYSNKALSKIIDFAAEERNKDESICIPRTGLAVCRYGQGPIRQQPFSKRTFR